MRLGFESEHCTQTQTLKKKKEKKILFMILLMKGDICLSVIVEKRSLARLK